MVRYNTVSPRKIDLLNLTNGALESLGSRPLPEGTYQQLRLVLSPNASGSSSFANSVVPSNSSTGAEVALSTPSSVQTGIKVIHPFTVQPDTLVDLVLDFCLQISCKDGQYQWARSRRLYPQARGHCGY